jgi:hypothetical protein
VVAELLEWMAMASFSGHALLDGTSLPVGQQGQRVCGEAIAIMDDSSEPSLHGDLLEALGRVGRELQSIPNTWMSGGAVLCPALLLRDFHFTGSSST